MSRVTCEWEGRHGRDHGEPVRHRLLPVLVVVLGVRFLVRVPRLPQEWTSLYVDTWEGVGGRSWVDVVQGFKRREG